MIFSNCTSLISVPDLSKWNTNNIKDMFYLFSDCFTLPFLPDISKWKNYEDKHKIEKPDYNMINSIDSVIVDFTTFTWTSEANKLLKEPDYLKDTKLTKWKGINSIFP